MDIGKMAHGDGIEHRAQGLFHVVAIEVGLDVQQEAGLHRHAAATEPVLVKIIDRVTKTAGEIKVVFVIFQYPFRFRGTRRQRAGDEQVHPPFEGLANPAKAPAAPLHI